VASNNPELLMKGDLKFMQVTRDKTIGELPLSLIEHYYKFQPKSVMLEYEKRGVMLNGVNGQGGFHITNDSQLKLTPSGEVVWSPVEGEHIYFIDADHTYPMEPTRAEVDVEKLADEEITKEGMKQEGISEKYFLGINYKSDWTEGAKWGRNKALQQRAEVKEPSKYTGIQDGLGVKWGVPRKEVKEESWEQVFQGYGKPCTSGRDLWDWLKENYHSPKPKNK